jgi:hypothetical protein
MDEKNYFSKTNIEVPLNIIKEKVNLALPETEVDDEAILGFSYALNHFLTLLAKKITIENSPEKKILIKDIKNCIENEKTFSFLKKVIEK